VQDFESVIGNAESRVGLHPCDFSVPVQRVFMLPLDSLSLPFVRSHLNCLPVFDRLIKRGSLRLLGSSGDFASESVWPSFCLGAHPGAHGQYFPFQWDARTMSFRRPVRGRWAQSFHSTRSGLP
jgi:predicted AlkP superfamily phosphohydrolase/phosphomutase